METCKKRRINFLKKIEQEINQYLLENMPSIMYHGSSGIRYTKNDFLDNIRIFNSINEYNEYESINGRIKRKGREIPRISFGRTNLDAAFHGLYLTPDYDEAYKWATKVFDKPGQLVKIKINKEEIIQSGCRSLCFPNYDWASFIIGNRNKVHNTFNSVPASYTLRADSKMNKLNDSIQSACSKADILELLPELIIDRVKLHQNQRNLEWDYSNFIKDKDILNGKFFQLCLSSASLLKSIEVVDIISIDKEGLYE